MNKLMKQEGKEMVLELLHSPEDPRTLGVSMSAQKEQGVVTE